MLDRKVIDRAIADTEFLNGLTIEGNNHKLAQLLSLREHLLSAVSHIDSLPNQEHPVQQLTDLFKADHDYAHSWHDTIAVCCFDHICEGDGSNDDWAHTKANNAASRFMKLRFNVETKA